MTSNDEQQYARFNVYGLLITVLSVQLLVIYSDGPFDYWDVLIGTLGGVFGFKYLRFVATKDIFEIGICSLIFTSSVLAIVFYIYGSNICNSKGEAQLECLKVDYAISEQKYFFLILFFSVIVIVAKYVWNMCRMRSSGSREPS